MTPTPVPSLTATRTATPTPSITPQPATQTQIAKHAAATQRIMAATATTIAKRSARTGTAAARTQYADKIAPYRPIRVEDLAVYTDVHIGEKVKIRGRVWPITDTSQFGLVIGNYQVIVLTANRFSDLHQNEWVTVYGTVDSSYSWSIGNYSFKAPVLRNAFYER